LDGRKEKRRIRRCNASKNRKAVSGDPRKHIFDALTYVIFSEMMEDMEIEDMERPVTSNGSVSMIHGGYDHAAIVP